MASIPHFHSRKPLEFLKNIKKILNRYPFVSWYKSIKNTSLKFVIDFWFYQINISTKESTLLKYTL